MFRIHANYAKDALSLYNLTVNTNFFDRRSNFHTLSFVLLKLFHPLHNPALGQIIWTHFQNNAVTREEPDIVDTHFP